MSTKTIGNIGNEPELKVLPSGKKILRYSIAESEEEEQDGKKVTNWVNVTLFGKSVQNAQKILHKGLRVESRGYMQIPWVDDKGIAHNQFKAFSVGIVPKDVKFEEITES